jgi:hypothetical protein
MIDMDETTKPKSKQINADHLRGISVTIKITKVSKIEGQQPIAIDFENEEGIRFLPCKSMRRVLKYVWGKDGAQYVGRSLTLFCDDKVTFGGVETGGVRISHMSHIDKPIQVILTESQKNRKPYTVRPLVAQDQHISKADETIIKAGNEAAASGVDSYTKWLSTLTPEVKNTVRHLHNGWTATAKEADAS